MYYCRHYLSVCQNALVYGWDGSSRFVSAPSSSWWIYTCAYTHTRMQTHANAHTHVHTYTHTSTHTTHTYIPAYLQTYVYTCKRAYMHICMCDSMHTRSNGSHALCARIRRGQKMGGGGVGGVDLLLALQDLFRLGHTEQT